MSTSTIHGQTLVKRVAQAGYRVWMPRVQREGGRLLPQVGASMRDMQFVPFRVRLQQDLQRGVLHNILGADEAIACRSHESVGDQHAYVHIAQTDLRARSARAELAYSTQAYDADSILRASTYVEEMPEQIHAREWYRRIDRHVVSLLTSKDAEPFLASTQRVAFRGVRSGREYICYYKCGPTFGAEAMARSMLQILGVATARIQQSSLPGAYWVNEVSGQSLEAFRLRIHAEYGSFQKWADDHLSASAAMAEALGRASIAMYVVGNDDFHWGNAIVDDEGAVSAIDLETVSLPSFQLIDAVRVPDMYLNAYLDVTNEGLFCRELAHRGYIFVGEHFAQHLLHGARSMLTHLQKPGVADALSDCAARNFIARGVVRGTVEYLVQHHLQQVVPHYSLPISGYAYAKQMRARTELLKHLSTHYRLRTTGPQSPRLYFERK